MIYAKKYFSVFLIHAGLCFPWEENGILAASKGAFLGRILKPICDLGSWCIKGTDESLSRVDSSVPLMHHDPNDLRSQIRFRILPKKHTLSFYVTLFLQTSKIIAAAQGDFSSSPYAADGQQGAVAAAVAKGVGKSNVIRAVIEKLWYPITVEVLYKVFRNTCTVNVRISTLLQISVPLKLAPPLEAKNIK